MAKARSKKPNIDYLVLKCGAPSGLVSLGIFGTMHLVPGLTVLFFVGNSPRRIEGFDDFEMKLVSAAPKAVRDDLKQLTSQNVPPDKLLDQVASRYRGTIFASERTKKAIPMAITSATSPQQILAHITSAIIQLAKDENVARSTKSKTRRRTAKTATRGRYVKAKHRQLRLPQQFELTTLHI